MNPSVMEDSSTEPVMVRVLINESSIVGEAEKKL